VLDAVLLVPVLLERVDADLTRLGDIGVEDLGEEHGLWWDGRELATKLELDAERTAFIGRAGYEARRGGAGAKRGEASVGGRAGTEGGRRACAAYLVQ